MTSTGPQGADASPLNSAFQTVLHATLSAQTLTNRLPGPAMFRYTLMLAVHYSTPPQPSLLILFGRDCMKGNISPVTFTEQEAALAILKMGTVTIRTKYS